MAITDLGEIGTNTVSGAGADISVTTTSAVRQGDLVVAFISWDQNNTATETGPDDDWLIYVHNDTYHDTWVRFAAGQYAIGGAGNGAHAGIYVWPVYEDRPSGTVITFTNGQNAALVDKTVLLRRFDMGGPYNIINVATASVTGSTTNNPAGLTVSGLDSGTEYLICYCLATNGNVGDTMTGDADYTSNTSQGNAGAFLHSAFRIVSGITSDTCDVSISNSRACKQVLCAMVPMNRPGIRWHQQNAMSATTAQQNGPTAASEYALSCPGDIVLIWGNKNNSNGERASPFGPGTLVGCCQTTLNYLTVSWWAEYAYRHNAGSPWAELQDGGDRNNVGNAILYGCAFEDEFPVKILIREEAAGASTSVTMTAGDTDVDNCLLYALLQYDANAGITSWASADGTTLTHQGNVSSASGPSGTSFAWGHKVTAGTVGAVTATIGSSADYAGCVLSIRPRFKERNQPTIRPLGPTCYRIQSFNSAAAVTASWSGFALQGLQPSYIRAGDLLIVAIHTENQAATMSSGGYTQMADSPQSSGTQRLTVFYKIADGTETGAGINDSGDHQNGVVLRVRNYDQADPFDVTAGNTETTDSTVEWPGDTTTGPHRLVISMTGQGLDNNFNTLARHFAINADLDQKHPYSILECAFWNSADGSGGGVEAVWGTKMAKGAFAGSTDAWNANEVDTKIVVAIRPHRPRDNIMLMDAP